jgi:hypothetical protein
MSRFGGDWWTRDYCHGRFPDRHTESIERGLEKRKPLRQLNLHRCWPKFGATVSLASVSVQPSNGFERTEEHSGPPLATARGAASTSPRTSWTWYAAGGCLVAAMFLPYVLISWFEFMAVRYVFFIAAIFFLIAYCLIDGSKLPGRSKRAANGRRK